MKTVNLAKIDLIDRFKAYQSEATFTSGNKSTHQMVAMSDIGKILDEVLEKYGHQNRYGVKFVKLQAPTPHP